METIYNTFDTCLPTVTIFANQLLISNNKLNTQSMLMLIFTQEDEDPYISVHAF